METRCRNQGTSFDIGVGRGALASLALAPARFDSLARRPLTTDPMLFRDLRYAFRTLSRAPGFTLAVVLTLGLGIGANTAIFSVVRGVLLRPLPHKDGDRLVYLRQSID